MLKLPSERWIRTDGRKIIFGTFPEADYLGLADIPVGLNLKLTFEETVRSKRTYLRKAKAVLQCNKQGTCVPQVPPQAQKLG